MNRAMLDFFSAEANNLEQAGLLRRELVMDSPRGATVTLGKKDLLNLCGTDYLGLASHADVKQAAKAAIDAFGAGLGAPRMLTGTLAVHVDLEKAVSDYLGTEDTLVFPSGYHAATGIFESMLSDKDYLVCDSQVQSPIADGIKLCRARIVQYRHRDLGDLEDRLRRSRTARFRMIATDGVFPLEGSAAPLREICDLAEKYEAMVVVEDSHGLGVLGQDGRGTAQHLNVATKVDLIVGSFAHALGGAEGGFASGPKAVIAWLRQKSRPHLTSSALSPAAAGAAFRALQLARAGGQLREQLRENTRILAEALLKEGFRVLQADHPTLSILLGDAVVTQRMTDLLYRKGVFAMGFCHPVVPEGSARVRVHVTVSHTQKDLLTAAQAFGSAGRELKVLGRK